MNPSTNQPCRLCGGDADQCSCWQPPLPDYGDRLGPISPLAETGVIVLLVLGVLSAASVLMFILL